MNKLATSIALAALLPISATFAESDTVSHEQVKDSLYIIQGDGGNILVQNGEQGTLMIDAKFARLGDAISSAISDIGGQTPEYLINTHYHGDHTGANEYFGEKGVSIIAHENVRNRLSEETYTDFFDRTTPPQPEAALPVITFSESMNVNFNGENIYIWHIPNAHTDGDSVVYFEKANVLHSGDLFFNGFFPYIDTVNGGSLEGMAMAVESLFNSVNEQTIIIPGHGPIADVEDLESFSMMLRDAYNALKPLKDDGLNVDEAIEKKPLAALEEQWGDGFIPTDDWIKIVYKNL